MTPDRLAAAVAQGHEDAVQAWPQEDREEAVERAAQIAHGRLMWAHKVNGFGTPWEALTESQRDGWREFVRDIAAPLATPAPVSSPAGEDVERVAREEAERRYRRQAMHVGTPSDRERAAFVEGAMFAALSARPVEAQEVERLRAVQQAILECRDDPASAIVRADRIAGEHIVRALDAERERDAALARAEAAEGRERALREAADDFESVVDYAHEVYEETDTEPAECTDECPGCAGERLRALLDGDSEGRES